MSKHRFRYEVAEEVLRNGGTNEEIHRRIMQEFRGSKANPTRANWYRRSWDKYGHCRGNSKAARQSLRADSAGRKTIIAPAPRSYDVDAELDKLEGKYADRDDIYVARLVHRLIRNDRELVNALKNKYGFRCQFPGCMAEIPIVQGGFYCEVAHLQAVSKGGAATRINLVVLCPNHHKMLDVGNLTVTSATRQEIVGTLNGRLFCIKR